MIDYFHVGDFKTGTTWLQHYGFRNHPEIRFLGDPFKNSAFYRLFYELTEARDLDFDAAELRRLIGREVARENKDGLKTLVSREVLSQSNFITGENARRNAERLRAVFGRPGIIYTIREQRTMVRSIYSQYVKMGGTLPVGDFLLDPIVARDLCKRLQYHKNISMYHEIFGPENVLVLLFDEFRENKALFLEKIFKFMKCRFVKAPGDNQASPVNQSLTQTGCFVQRQLNRLVRNPLNQGANLLPLDRLLSHLLPSRYLQLDDRRISIPLQPELANAGRAHLSRQYINRALTLRFDRLCSRIKSGGPVTVPDTFWRAIEHSCRASNRILLKKYGLSVDRYNWTV